MGLVAITYVGIGTSAGVTSGNLTLTEPAGVAADDVLVACIGTRGSNVVTLPASWQAIAQDSGGNTNLTTSGIAGGLMCYIVRGGSAPDLTWVRTAGTNQASYGAIIALRGCDITSATSALSNFASNGNDPSPLNVPAAYMDTLSCFFVAAMFSPQSASSTATTWSLQTVTWQYKPTITPSNSSSTITERVDSAFNVSTGRLTTCIATTPAVSVPPLDTEWETFRPIVSFSATRSSGAGGTNAGIVAGFRPAQTPQTDIALYNTVPFGR